MLIADFDDVPLSRVPQLFGKKSDFFKRIKGVRCSAFDVEAASIIKMVKNNDITVDEV